MHPDKVYQELLKDVLENGELTTTRAKDPKTGQPVKAYSVFGRQVRFNLREGFPLLTTKKMFTKGIIHELLWFLKGDTNIKYLQDNGVHIWDEWANKDGELVSCYGQQWRRWEVLKENTSPTAELAKKLGANIPYNKQEIDQIAKIIKEIKTNPTSRRLIVSAWNPNEVDQASLPWCHAMFQFKVSHNETRLNCQLYQRSADIFLGVPFNIVSYALLTHMIAQVCGLEVGDFIHTFGDLHLYENHIEQVKLQLTREPYLLPTLVLNPNIKCIDDFKYEDIKIENYTSHPSIKGDVAV